MEFFTVILIAVALSMDSFAVSVTGGFILNDVKPKQAAKIAIFLAFFQGIMPFFGWLLGISVASKIQKYDHWIALLLLSFVGGRMILESFKVSCEDYEYNPLCNNKLTYLGIATSIDALIIGANLAFLNISILFSCVIISLITFIFSFSGVYIGSKIGAKYNLKAELIGGIILILIGIKILIEHLIKGI
jgi:putative Mn2+ efflux pump MntP